MTTSPNPVHLARGWQVRSVAANVSRFVLEFLKLQVAMGLGALLCFLLGRLVPPTSPIATVYYPGSYLYAIGDVFFLTLPVVAWIIFRDHEWQRSGWMAVAMLAPVAAIALVGELAGYRYLPWLIVAGYPAMSLGMFVYMLYRAHERRPVGRSATWHEPRQVEHAQL
jgi:hypothetical protein